MRHIDDAERRARLVSRHLLDTRAGAFLDTAGRRNLLRQLPVVSVPVLFEGALRREEHLRRLLGPSAYRTARVLDLLREAAGRLNLAPAEILRMARPTAPNL